MSQPTPLRPLSPADRRTVAWLFAALACLYLLSTGGHFYASDDWQKFQALRAMVFERTVFFADGWTPGVGGNTSFYPLGGSLLMLPGMLLGYGLAPLAPMVPDEFVARFCIAMQNAFLTAGLVALFFAYLRRLALPVGGALFAAAALGLGTFLWPYAKTCWSEPGTALALFGAFYLLQVASAERFARTAPVLVAGTLLAAALLTRLEVALVAPGALAWLVWRHRGEPGPLARAMAVMAVPLAAAVAACLAFNAARYGHALTFSNWNTVQAVTVFGPGGRPAWALNNLWHYTLNPSDGTLWFSPAVALGLAGMARFVRAHRAEAALALMAFLPLAVFYVGFWGLSDWAWGLRYAYVFLPFLLLPAAGVWAAASAGGAARAACAAVLAAGVAVQLLGVVHNFGYLYERERERFPGITIQAIMADAAHAPLRLAARELPATLAGGWALLGTPPPPAPPTVAEIRQRSQLVPDLWYLLQLLTTVPRWLVAAGFAALLAGLSLSTARLAHWARRAAGT